ncbi:integrin alpha-3-like isoform X2 [Syngnathoides biaculeatus]|uniref:integrin alpha-3-like isoform X2 n=1 Tax=Syngnathoides biaculeatus TaxID=300417 RepID=UPI002ADDE640|nr:integrin alpha-3-like isoform X2 [Syngnathoides biaculeatus]
MQCSLYGPLYFCVHSFCKECVCARLSFVFQAMSACVSVSVATCVCLLVSSCAASNVDTRFPLVKTGADGTFFGLSVALHSDLKSRTHLLLVGAPRERAEPDVPANRTGGVYSCPITADPSDCRRLSLIDRDLDLSEDLVEDMWLGVSLASQGPPGGRVLACGHRFVKVYGASKLRHMIGRCYLRDGADDQWRSLEQLCSHLGDVSREVMCNSGMSAAIFRRDLIVGSPGSYQWQGNVHVTWTNPRVIFDTGRSSFPNLQRRNIYLGYSVTQAAGLLSRDDVTIVTGAPKDTKEDARGSVLLAVKGAGAELTVRQTLRGEQTGSYFGNAVAAADLDNDGWQDLLVGAPFYFQRQRGVGGAVYVYMNAGGRFRSTATSALKGPPASAFGMAVAHAGDLDGDGFQDFAVGAPFHGTGSVMIWRGSGSGVSARPGQVISGSSLSPRLSTFGFSLSGGLDVDGNGHPDLLVGSLDDTAVLLRSRPVIHLNKTIRVSPNIVEPNTCDFCISVEVCFSYTWSSGDERRPDNITVHFSVAADVGSPKPRLRFRGNAQSTYSASVLVPRQRCRTLIVGLPAPVRDRVAALVFSLDASVNQKIPKNKDPLQDLGSFPVLSQRSQPVRTQVHIQKSCGSDNRCRSNLQMAAHFTDAERQPLSMRSGRQVWSYGGGADRLLLWVNVSNTAEDAHLAVLNVTVPPALVYSGVRTKGGGIHKVQCSVEGSVVLCELGNPFQSNRMVEVWIIFEASELSCDNREAETLLQMSTLSEQTDLSPISLSLIIKYSVDMSLTLTHRPGPVPFGGHVPGESAVRTTEDVGPLLIFTFQVHLGGSRRGDPELTFDWPSQLSNGKRLLYLTEISLNGSAESRCVPPGDVVDPLRLKMGGRRERRSLVQEEEVQEDEGAGPGAPVRHFQTNDDKSYVLDCVNGGAKCVRFTCPLPNVKKRASVTLRARLWKATMLEHYLDARGVLVRGQATLRLGAFNTEAPNTRMEVHVYPYPERRVGSDAPPWIIGVSVLAGLVLLALICALLWKSGFFVRGDARHRGPIAAPEERDGVSAET